MSRLTKIADLISSNELDMCNEDDRSFVEQQLGINKTKPKHTLKTSIVRIFTNLFKHLRIGFKK